MLRIVRILLAAPVLWLAACQDAESPIAPEAPSPTLYAAGGPPFVSESVTTGEAHACALTASGQAYCWGANWAGQLGDGSTTGSSTPVAVSGGLRFVSLGAGGNHTCGITRAGELHCWGWNIHGQLGNGSISASSAPVPVSGGLAFESVSAGWTHTCAVTAAGEPHCWGSNAWGQLGATATEVCSPANRVSVPCSTVPLAVRPGVELEAISTGFFHTCGLAGDGTAHCWGHNGFGQFGDGTRTPRNETPTPAAGGLRFSSFSSGTVHSCGVTETGAAYCWGWNYAGNLGNGSSQSTEVPVPVAGGLAFASIYASTGNNVLPHTCGITTSGEAYCWGSNQSGQLGSTLAAETCNFSFAGITFTCSTTPIPVSGGLVFQSIDLGNAFTCGVTTSYLAHCWGRNGAGQLGNGSTDDSSTLVRVAAPGYGRTRTPPPHAATAAEARIVD